MRRPKLSISGPGAPRGARPGCSKSVTPMGPVIAPPARRAKCGATKRPAPCGPASIKLSCVLVPDDDQGADADPLVEVHDVLVGEADAARRHGLPDCPWLGGAVDAIQRRADI